ncbi:MAG: ParB N-terminal domain-containing protein [Gammaproteobacteria bacterium]|nr:ParB N-terminal domain-containing protein [Gammaproteobacteria bacterium]
MIIRLSTIELDQSTQCRAEMNQETIDDYAGHMANGVKFPPIEVFGTASKSYIGDGWHRVLAARDNGFTDIEANVNHGGRVEAIKCALKANSVHGLRRTTADKRRSVEIALQEFGNMSSRAIAEMCGVSDFLVNTVKPQVLENSTSTVIGQDGKTYPATKPEPKEVQPAEHTTTEQTNPPRPEPLVYEPDEQEPKWDAERASMAMQYARMAISQLERIGKKDVKRHAAFDAVSTWMKEHYNE